MNDLKLNLDKIKARGPREYDQLIGALSLAGIHATTGEVTVTESQWRQLSAVHGKLIPVLQAIVNEHEKFCGCNDCFNKRVAEQMQGENERLALVAQQKAAEARIMEYVAQGLENTEANRDIFMTAWKTHPALKVIEIPTVQLVDAVIALVCNKLSWRKPTPPTPALALAPEPVVILSDGSEQLPIDAIPSTRHTVEQLRDLDHRHRVARAGESGVLPPLENREPRLPLGTKPSPSHSVAQRRDLELRTARAWARQSGSHGSSFFQNDSEVR